MENNNLINIFVGYIINILNMKYNIELLNKISELTEGAWSVQYLKKGGIHIKEKNRGKFTAAAKKAGKSVQEHARDVLKNPNSTPLQRKRANFAIQAKRWHKK